MRDVLLTYDVDRLTKRVDELESVVKELKEKLEKTFWTGTEIPIDAPVQDIHVTIMPPA